MQKWLDARGKDEHSDVAVQTESGAECGDPKSTIRKVKLEVRDCASLAWESGSCSAQDREKTRCF